MSSDDPKSTSPDASSFIAGVTPRAWLIGSAPLCDVVLTSATVSRRHCRLILDSRGYSIEDLHSSNGTYVDGARVYQTVRVRRGQTITLGRRLLFPWDRILGETPGDLHAPPPRDGILVRVGRNPDNDIVLDAPAVSSYHAHLILSETEAPLIEDLGSVNGTALNRVDRKIHSAALNPTDWVFFGSHKVAAAELLKLARERRQERPIASVQQPNPAPEAIDIPDNDKILRPEIVSVFFTDIVGFTTLNPAQQMKSRLQLEGYVQASNAFRRGRSSRSVVIRPTGDGMALVFFTHPSDAAECAAQVARMIAKDGTLPVRMGINQGTVYRLKDLNGNDDVNGRGINMAQRIMDAADCGEICISASVAESLRGTIEWSDYIHRIGMKRIKHGESIEVFSLCGEDFGKYPPVTDQ